MTMIFRCVVEERMYKKRSFYTYARTEKYSPKGKKYAIVYLRLYFGTL